MYIHRRKSLKEPLQGPATPAVQTDNYEPFQIPHTNPLSPDSGQNPYQTLTSPEPDYELPGPYYNVIPAVREEGGREPQSNPSTTGQYENVAHGKKPMDVTAHYVNVNATQGGLSGETSSDYANVPL